MRERSRERVFQLSGFPKDVREDLQKLITRIGNASFITSAAFDDRCTFVVIKRPNRSEKFLCGLARGLPILTESYITDSAKQKKWLCEDPYIWSPQHIGIIDDNYRREKVMLAEMLTAPRRCIQRFRRTRQPALKGWVCAVKVKDESNAKVYRRILRAAGANIKGIPDSVSSTRHIPFGLTHLITEPAFRYSLMPVSSQGVHCIRQEYLGDFLIMGRPPKETDYIMPYCSVIDLTNVADSTMNTSVTTDDDVVEVTSDSRVSRKGTNTLPPSEFINHTTASRKETVKIRNERRSVPSATTVLPKREPIGMDNLPLQTIKRLSSETKSSEDQFTKKIKLEPDVVNHTPQGSGDRQSALLIKPLMVGSSSADLHRAVSCLSEQGELSSPVKQAQPAAGQAMTTPNRPMVKPERTSTPPPTLVSKTLISSAVTRSPHQRKGSRFKIDPKQPSIRDWFSRQNTPSKHNDVAALNETSSSHGISSQETEAFSGSSPLALISSPRHISQMANSQELVKTDSAKSGTGSQHLVLPSDDELVNTSELTDQDETTPNRPVIDLALKLSLASALSRTGQRQSRCGLCDGCKKDDCGKCRQCQDKQKFGGPGRLKQACRNKACTAMIRHSKRLSQKQNHKTSESSSRRMCQNMVTSSRSASRSTVSSTKVDAKRAENGGGDAKLSLKLSLKMDTPLYYTTNEHSCHKKACGKCNDCMTTECVSRKSYTYQIKCFEKGNVQPGKPSETDCRQGVYTDPPHPTSNGLVNGLNATIGPADGLNVNINSSNMSMDTAKSGLFSKRMKDDSEPTLSTVREIDEDSDATVGSDVGWNEHIIAIRTPTDVSRNEMDDHLTTTSGQNTILQNESQELDFNLELLSTRDAAIVGEHVIPSGHAGRAALMYDSTSMTAERSKVSAAENVDIGSAEPKSPPSEPELTADERRVLEAPVLSSLDGFDRLTLASRQELYNRCILIHENIAKFPPHPASEPPICSAMPVSLKRQVEDQFDFSDPNNNGVIALNLLKTSLCKHRHPSSIILRDLFNMLLTCQAEAVCRAVYQTLIDILQMNPPVSAVTRAVLSTPGRREIYMRDIYLEALYHKDNFGTTYLHHVSKAVKILVEGKPTKENESQEADSGSDSDDELYRDKPVGPVGPPVNLTESQTQTHEMAENLQMGPRLLVKFTNKLILSDCFSARAGPKSILLRIFESDHGPFKEVEIHKGDCKLILNLIDQLLTVKETTLACDMMSALSKLMEHCQKIKKHAPGRQIVASISTSIEGKNIKDLDVLLLEGLPPMLAYHISRHMLSSHDRRLVTGCIPPDRHSLLSIISNFWFVIPLSSAKIRSAAGENSSPSPKKRSKKINMKGETQLHRACIKNDIDWVKNLLALPETDVNAPDYAGWTPLHEAANHGHLEIVRLLLQYQPPGLSMYSTVNLKAQNQDGLTPLHDAVGVNQPAVVQLLIKYGGKELVNVKDVHGRTALDMAPTVDLHKILKDAPENPLHQLAEISVVPSPKDYFPLETGAAIDDMTRYASLCLNLLTLYLKCHQLTDSDRQVLDNLNMYMKAFLDHLSWLGRINIPDHLPDVICQKVRRLTTLTL